MSVQAGILYFDGRPVERDVLVKLSGLSGAFGPDGESIHAEESLAMLYRPFHTTVESQNQQQPLATTDGNIFTWDGRLDNRNECISESCGATDQRPADVVILSKAFDKWGADCFKKLVGEWAACVWNSRERELLLARDYIGVRQLFYTVQSRSVAWCNLLTALIECGDSFTVSDEYVAGYLARKPEAHLTPFCEIRSVPPGSFVRIRNGKLTTHTYWNFDPAHRSIYRTDGEYEEHYRGLFRQAVKRRLRSNGTILASLSGGLDSSSIVCMADQIVSADKTVRTSVDTVSYYDLSEPDDDDLSYLKLVEAKRGRAGFHLELHGNGDTFALQYSSLAASPGFGAGTDVQDAMEVIVTKGQHRVLLSGMGGDEMNGQSLKPLVPIAELIVNGHLIQAAHQLFDWSLLTRTPYYACLTSALSELVPIAIRAWISKFELRRPWVTRQFAKKQRMAARELEEVAGIWCFRPGARDALQTITTLSRELTRLAPSRLEHRYPYLDQDLVQFLTSVPFDQLLRRGDRRSLMRRALVGIVPAEILRRRTKVSAARCFALTLIKHWEEIRKSLDSSLAESMGFINGEILREYLHRLANGQETEMIAAMLKALSLEFWLRDICARKAVKPSVKVL